MGAQAFAWVLVLPPGEALLLLFSDKLICISVTPPASSQPLSPPCCLSADCQKFIYLTPKKLTQTPVRRTTAYPGTPPFTPPHDWGRGLSRETKSDLFACPKIGLQLSCNYATTKHLEGRRGGRNGADCQAVRSTNHHLSQHPRGAHTPPRSPSPPLACMASNIF